MHLCTRQDKRLPCKRSITRFDTKDEYLFHHTNANVHIARSTFRVSLADTLYILAIYFSIYWGLLQIVDLHFSLEYIFRDILQSSYFYHITRNDDNTCDTEVIAIITSCAIARQRPSKMITVLRICTTCCK